MTDYPLIKELGLDVLIMKPNENSVVLARELENLLSQSTIVYGIHSGLGSWVFSEANKHTKLAKFTALLLNIKPLEQKVSKSEIKKAISYCSGLYGGHKIEEILIKILASGVKDD